MFLLVSVVVVSISDLWAHSVNKVQLELRDTGRYRVNIAYTIPELKELREAYVEFDRKQDADRYYFHLLQGGDFYIPEGKAMRQNPKVPEPW